MLGTFLQRIVLSLFITAVPLAVLAQPAAPANMVPSPPVAPQPTPPASALPAINLPISSVGQPLVMPPVSSPAISQQVGAESSQMPAPGVQQGQVSDTMPSADGQKLYSYGESDLSILFLPDQVSAMKNAIRAFEDTGAAPLAPVEVAKEMVAAPVVEKIEDATSYPNFFLSSIVYDDAKDWSVWVSGYKITSRLNLTDVQVLSVSPDSATFLWTPSFAKALAKRKEQKLFAPLDDVKSKLAPIQRASFDAATGAVVFTLKPNQTFAVGYFKTFEGYIDGPMVEPLSDEALQSASALASQSGAVPSFDSFGQPIPPNTQAGVPSRFQSVVDSASPQFQNRTMPQPTAPIVMPVRPN